MGAGSGRAGRAGQQVEAGEAAIDHRPATSGVAVVVVVVVVVVVAADVGVGAAIVGVVVVVVGVGCGGAAAVPVATVAAAAAENGGMFEVNLVDPVGKLQDSGGCDVRLWLRPRTDERRMGCKRHRR